MPSLGWGAGFTAGKWGAQQRGSQYPPACVGFHAWEMGSAELFNPSTSSPSSEQGQASSLSSGREEGQGRDAGVDALTLTAAAL